MRMGDTPTAPNEQAERKSEGEDVLSARDWHRNAPRDQVAGQPIPYADLAGNIEEKKRIPA